MKQIGGGQAWWKFCQKFDDDVAQRRRSSVNWSNLTEQVDRSTRLTRRPVRGSPDVGGEQPYQLLVVEAGGDKLLPGHLAVAVHVHPLEDGGGPHLGGLVRLSPATLGSSHTVD